MKQETLPAGSRSKVPDGRIQRSKGSVLKATSELLTESGLGGVTVDEVSRRSGVAKTTIYRHWPTRSDLVMDACSKISTQQDVPDTGSFEGDLMHLLTDIAERLQTAKWSSVLPSIIDEAERDPCVAEIHSAIQRGHTAPLQQVIKRAIDKGEIPRDTNQEALIASLLGPLFYCRWFSREPIDSGFVRGMVRNTLGYLRHVN